MIPITRNCNSCILCDDVIGCRLTGNISPARCIFNGFAYYKKGKQLFYCERCKTNSVTSSVVGFMEDPQDPRINFWCQRCDDIPIIESYLSNAPGERYQIERRHQKLSEFFEYFQKYGKIMGDK